MGEFWDEHAIDMPVTGEIPIYPMTVKDELTLKTPDALMNGTGVVELIHSCCPNIKNAWKIPVSDLDPLLISIRMASYGTDMDVTTTCPHCSTLNENTVNLRILLSTLNPPKYNAVELNKLTFKFKPQDFHALNQTNMIVFEQQRLIRSINDSTLSEEERLAHFNSMFPNLTDMNIMAIVNNIESITIEDGTVVSDQKYIKEFIMNCERAIYSEIKEHINKLAEQNKMEPITVTCDNCAELYKSDITFEQSSFFG